MAEDGKKFLIRRAVMSMFWSNYPYTLGSYCGAKVGQYTTMLDEGGETSAWRPPAICRRAHTAVAPKRFGFMNGGVLSGNRAAGELLKLMALPPQGSGG